jgi:hypothetical protein
MRYLPLVLAAFFAFDGTPAHADPISAAVVNATMFMGPNFGSGDNIFFRFTGPGVDIEGIGGMACFDWCTGGPIPPGTPINLTRIFISNFTTAIVGGVAYDPNSEFGLFDSSSFFDDAGGVSGSVRGFVGQGETFSEVFLSMPSGGSWTLNFTGVLDEQGNDTTAFVNGTFSAGPITPTPTPEPGTLGLMFLGSAGIWITARRRRSPMPAAATPGHRGGAHLGAAVVRVKNCRRSAERPS